MKNKGKHVLEPSFLSMLLDSMADGVFTLRRHGSDINMERGHGTHNGLYGRGRHWSKVLFA